MGFGVQAGGAYGTGDLMGCTVAQGGATGDKAGFAQNVIAPKEKGHLQHIFLVDKADTSSFACDLVFFDSDPTADHSNADNAAFNLTDAGALKAFYTVNIATGDWVDLGGCKIAMKNPNIPISPDKTSLYVMVIPRAAYTAGADGDLSMRITIEQDQ
jgi:hypothetical protein